MDPTDRFRDPAIGDDHAEAELGAGRAEHRAHICAPEGAAARAIVARLFPGGHAVHGAPHAREPRVR